MPKSNETWAVLNFNTPYDKSNSVFFVDGKDIGLMINTKDQMSAILKNWNNALGEK